MAGTKSEKATTDTEKRDTRKRVSFFVDEAGALDASTKDDTKAALVKMLGADQTRVLLKTDGGLGGAATAAPEKPGTDANVVGALYLMLGRIEVLAAKLAGIPEDRAQLLAFTDEEVARLIGPTKAVLDKHDVSFGKYEEEFALGATLMPIVLAKIALVRGGAGPAVVVDDTATRGRPMRAN